MHVLQQIAVAVRVELTSVRETMERTAVAGDGLSIARVLSFPHMRVSLTRNGFLTRRHRNANRPGRPSEGGRLLAEPMTSVRSSGGQARVKGGPSIHPRSSLEAPPR